MKIRTNIYNFIRLKITMSLMLQFNHFLSNWWHQTFILLTTKGYKSNINCKTLKLTNAAKRAFVVTDRASKKLEEIWSVLYTVLTNTDGAKKEVQHNVWTLCCHHSADFESDSQIGHLPCVRLFFFFYCYHISLLITWKCPFCLDTKSLVRKVLLINLYNEQSIHKNYEITYVGHFKVV